LGTGESSPLLNWLLDPQYRNRQVEHLRRYFTTYSGRYFEQFLKRAETNQFTPWDILAIEALAVSLPSGTVHWLLEPDQVRDDLLIKTQKAGLPRSTLWSCEIAQLRSGGSLSDLYELLREHEGMGVVTTSKLLAAKFPSVVPIRDSRVEDLIEMTDSLEWWEPIRRLFDGAGAGLEEHLAGLPLPAGSSEITVLRRLDVILWMESRARDRLS